MSEENVEAVRRCLDGWNRGDVEAWGRDAHPEIEWYSAVSRAWRAPRAPAGSGGDARVLGRVALGLGARIDVAEIRDLGDTVVALGTMRARGGASGIRLESPVGYVFEFDGGLVRKVRAYLDLDEALAAAGLSE